MKTKLFTIFFLLIMLVSLLISSTGFSQRYRHGRGYYGHYYYPYRSYSYFHPYVSVRFGSYYYRYQKGYFYRPYGSFFQFVFPPFGIRIATLPFGYSSFYLGLNPYYYYNGIFYRPYANEYEVVAPPPGAVVNRLPPASKVKIIDGQKYYELNGTYYKEQFDEKNRLSYLVVGTDGVLNTDKNENISSGPQVGDRIDQLPPDSKPVIISGEKLYATSSGLYYKEVTEGNKIYYELVGK
ncbi:MAG: DUF6515 family protein [Chitinophagales bacterium]